MVEYEMEYYIFSFCPGSNIYVYMYLSDPKTRSGVLRSRFGVLRSRTSFLNNSFFHVLSYVLLLRPGCVLNVFLTTCLVRFAAFWFAF